MFNLLDEFASKKNPYASILYKKLTFLFVQNHEQQTMRQFILCNLQQIFKKFSSIPVEIFLQPFIKQVKITENKSYFLQIFDMNFIRTAAQHKKLKVNTGIELYDLLAKIKLNNNCYVQMANEGMGILLDRFMDDQLFFDYTVKLVKISLAMFYSSLKQKKQFDDHQRIQAQKRAEIINFVISLIERANNQLNQEIKSLVIHVKIQIQNRLNLSHKGIERILGYFPDAQQALEEAIQNIEETQSNATTKTKSQFHLPKIQSRNQLIKERQKDRDRDEVASQQSNQTNSSKFSRGTNRSNKEFEMKEYTKFADQQEKNFMKEHNIQSKKPDFKAKKAPTYGSIEKEQSIDPKLQSHIAKLKQRKQQQEVRKIRQKQILERKKEVLKQKIQKQLQQRNIKQGVMGNQKDIQVKVIFEQNELNEKLFQNTQEDEEVYFYKNVALDQEEQRDAESIRIILRKNINFIKKIFTKYACAKVVKKDYFEEKTDMTQTDLLRLCKEKNLQRSKQPVLQILKEVNNKNIKSIDIEVFPCFLENLCIFLYFKQKVSTHIPMGDFLREKILKKMAVGQNMKLDDEQDEQTKIWSEKVRYNPQIQLPQNFKKITERIYYPNKQCSYPVKKAVKMESYLACFEVLNSILYEKFKFNILQEQVRFKDELKVAPKKQPYLPPKPAATKQQKQRDQSPKGLLLKETQQIPSKKRDNSVSKPTPNIKPKPRSQSIQKENQNNRGMSQSRQRPKNAAQKKKIQEQQNERIKRQHQEQLRKIRQLQVKRKLQKQKQLREQQKQQKKQEQKKKKSEDQQKKKQLQQQQQAYKQKQKEKLQKYRKQQQEKQQAEKQRRKQEREKQQQEKKQKVNKLKAKEQQKRQQTIEKSKKQRQMSEQNKKKQKQEEEKKKEILRKQVLKKLQGQKEKYQIQKTIKELTKQVFTEPSVIAIFDENKQQLKAMWNYGKQYNEYKLGSNSNQTILQSKGFITLFQQFAICDVPTANKLLKVHQKDTGLTGFTYEQFEQTLFTFNIKPVLEKEMENYDNAVKESEKVLRKFIAKLNIPKDKMLIKDFFLNLKNQKNDNSKKRKLSTANEEVQITNMKGEKENWQIQNDIEQ